MRKIPLFLALVAIVTTVVTATPFNQPVASALTPEQRATCSAASTLTSTPWESELQKDGYMPDFDPNNSYVMFQTSAFSAYAPNPGDPTTFQFTDDDDNLRIGREYQMYVAPAGSEGVPTLGKNSTTNQYYLYFPKGYTQVRIMSVGDRDYNDALIKNGVRITVSTPTAATPQTINLGTQFTAATGVVCTMSAHNVGYSASWPQSEYLNSTMVSTAPPQSEPQCSALDIACHMRGIVAGIADTFMGLWEAFGSVMAFLFVPDSEGISQIFNSLKDEFINKLGFIAYPVVFVEKTYGAMQNGTGMCQPSSCVVSSPVSIGGGTGNLSVDLLRFSHGEFSPIWNVFVNLVRGLTVLALVALLFRKFKEYTAV